MLKASLAHQQHFATPMLDIAADGVPKVADLGLARTWEAETATCLSGETGEHESIDFLPVLPDPDCPH